MVMGVATLGSFLYVPIPPSHLYIHTLGFTQFYLGSAALMIGVLLCQIPTNAVTRPLAALGSHSYSIYLWHMALMFWAIPHLQHWSWHARTLLYFVGAFVIGVAMARLVELPMLRLRDRLYPSRTEARPTAVLPAVEQRRAA
jgi:peptidoglycan/LPS O-acetylase OafA/YrhL